MDENLSFINFMIQLQHIPGLVKNFTNFFATINKNFLMDYYIHKLEHLTKKENDFFIDKLLYLT